MQLLSPTSSSDSQTFCADFDEADLDKAHKTFLINKHGLNDEAKRAGYPLPNIPTKEKQKLVVSDNQESDVVEGSSGNSGSEEDSLSDDETPT